MDYKVTWLDHESTILGNQVFVDDDSLDLAKLSEQITFQLKEGLVPEGTTHYSVELYDQ